MTRVTEAASDSASVATGTPPVPSNGGAQGTPVMLSMTIRVPASTVSSDTVDVAPMHRSADRRRSSALLRVSTHVWPSVVARARYSSGSSAGCGRMTTSQS